MTVISNAYGNVVSSFFGAKFGKHVEEMLVSPLPNSFIILGHVFGGVIRGLLVGLLVLIIALFFTDLTVQHVAITISVVVLAALVFSLAGFINAIYARDFEGISVIPTFVLTPLTYLGGVFYSVRVLPGWAEAATHANPIFYMVNAFRYGLLGEGAIDMPLWSAFAVMAGFILALTWLALRLLTKGVGLRS